MFFVSHAAEYRNFIIWKAKDIMSNKTPSPLSPFVDSTATLIPNRRILDKRFIAQLVNAPVKEFAISAGARYGDNAMGRLLSIDVKTQTNDILHLVIKSVLPMTGVIDRKTLDNAKNVVEWNPFPNEICYYKVIRPILQEACEKTGDMIRFSIPKYFSSYTDAHGLNDYLALEDLRPCGFKMANKFKGLGYEEVLAVLKELAFFHAISYSLLEKKHEKLYSMVEDPNSTLNTFNWDSSEGSCAQVQFNSIVSKSVEILRENGQLKVSDKMERFVKNGHAIILNLWRKTKEDKSHKYFQTLIHGDLCTTNILFQYARDERTVQHVKFVDFQRCRLGNVYEDLLNFIFTSTTAEFRKNHLRTCLETYFQEFSRVHQNHQERDLPPGFTEAELIQTFYENLEYGFAYNLYAIPHQLGLQPPPPSPMTPIEGDFSSAFFPFLSSSSSSTAVQQTAGSSDINATIVNRKEIVIEAVKAEAEVMKTAVRNSPTAQKRLKELAEEMIDHGVLLTEK